MLGRIKDIEKSTSKKIIKELHLVDLNSEKEFTAIGPIIDAIPGNCVDLTGIWVGETFKFTRAEYKNAGENEEVQKLLNMNLALTEDQAIAVVKLTEAEDIGCDFKEKLLNIDGIGPVKAERIFQLITKRRMKEKLLDLLVDGNAKEDVILKCFSDDAVTPEMIFKDPYLLIDYGETFSTCDYIAKKTHFAPYSDDRIHGAIKYALMRQESAGNTKVQENELCTIVDAESGKSNVNDAISNTLTDIYAASDEMLSINGDCTYSFATTAEYEYKIAENILRLNIAKEESDVAKDQYIRQAEKELGITYTSEQREAFSLLEHGGVKLLTGGPGTGKTLTIAGLVKSYLAYHPEKRILLCAPTGRAAARMKELAGDGIMASTMHKALGLSHFMKGKKEPLEYDLIICDEMSMADTELTALFLSAVTSRTKLLLAGDYRQLPSVGPGRVFRDLIESNILDTVHLTKVARQKSGSTIPLNAHRIMTGKIPTEEEDFEIMYFRNDYELEKAIRPLVYRESAMVLCPLRKGKYGSEAIARKLQSTRIFEDKPVLVGLNAFHVGDKVLFNKNNYDVGYINGDIGEILEISLNECKVQITDQVVTLKQENFSDMSLAYCMTVHKSQGSESDNVDLILPEAAGNLLLTREILYTAVTRAKRHVRIFTTYKAMETAVTNEMVSKRFCDLKEKLLRLA